MLFIKNPCERGMVICNKKEFLRNENGAHTLFTKNSRERGVWCSCVIYDFFSRKGNGAHILFTKNSHESGM